jgi:hypothetical protein
MMGSLDGFIAQFALTMRRGERVRKPSLQLGGDAQ